MLPWRITFLNSLFQSVPLESPHIRDSESAIAELKPYVYAVTRRQASAESTLNRDAIKPIVIAMTSFMSDTYINTL